MRLPFYLPKWAIVSLLLVAGCVAGWRMHDSSDSSDRSSALLRPGDPWLEEPDWMPGVGDDLLDSEAGTSPDAETLDGGVHMGAVRGPDGQWRVAGSSGPREQAIMPIASHTPVYGYSNSNAVPYAPSSGQPPRAPAAAGGYTASPLVIPPFFGEALFTPLAGAPSRGVAFSEWESYRTDVAGENILVTTDDSNFFRDRDGKINGNTGDTDASGLNVADATDSIIFGSESADFPPWDPNGSADEEEPEEPEEPAESEEEESEEDEAPDEVDDGAIDSQAVIRAVATMLASAPAPDGAAVAAVVAPSECDPDGDDCGDDDAGGSSDDFDFPYVEWVQSASRDVATAVHTDEGTTLASGADALVIGADGYDDDDNRAAGSNIIITRDDGNVVIGGTGDVNAQIGDSEQGAVIMDVERVFIRGGGAY